MVQVYKLDVVLCVALLEKIDDDVEFKKVDRGDLYRR